MEREERCVWMKQKGLDDLVLPSSDFLLNGFSPASGLAASWQTLFADIFNRVREQREDLVLLAV
jgi:hypothetical protein